MRKVRNIRIKCDVHVTDAAKRDVTSPDLVRDKFLSYEFSRRHNGRRRNDSFPFKNFNIARLITSHSAFAVFYCAIFTNAFFRVNTPAHTHPRELYSKYTIPKDTLHEGARSLLRTIPSLAYQDRYFIFVTLTTFAQFKLEPKITLHTRAINGGADCKQYGDSSTGKGSAPATVLRCFGCPGRSAALGDARPSPPPLGTACRRRCCAAVPPVPAVPVDSSS